MTIENIVNKCNLIAIHTITIISNNFSFTKYVQIFIFDGED